MEDDRLVHYKININLIQNDHSLIMQQFHECYTELENKKNIKEMLDYIYINIQLHFENEEKFMNMIKYPYVSYHEKEHRRIGSYYKKIIDSSKEINFQNRFTISALQEIFLKHIDEQDTQIEKFYYSRK